MHEKKQAPAALHHDCTLLKLERPKSFLKNWTTTIQKGLALLDYAFTNFDKKNVLVSQEESIVCNDIKLGLEKNDIRRKLSSDVDELIPFSPIQLVPTFHRSGEYFVSILSTSTHPIYMTPFDHDAFPRIFRAKDLFVSFLTSLRYKFYTLFRYTFIVHESTLNTDFSQLIAMTSMHFFYVTTIAFLLFNSWSLQWHTHLRNSRFFIAV